MSALIVKLAPIIDGAGHLIGVAGEKLHTAGSFLNKHKTAILVGTVAIAAIVALGLLFIPGAPFAAIGSTVANFSANLLEKSVKVKYIALGMLGYTGIGALGLGIVLALQHFRAKSKPEDGSGSPILIVPKLAGQDAVSKEINTASAK